ncbi:hypothetical protein CBS101457_006957 [Exobasidium rhododendri]|nr:hypothetical protein CBS101457_006957 [Exobasidium rhododendri]
MQQRLYTSATTADQVASDLSAQIRGKVILITGVTSHSLGAEFAMAISKHAPQILILAGRNKDRLQDMESKVAASQSGMSVQTRLLVLDLASQQQIRIAAEEVLNYRERIDVLVNSAGIMAPSMYRTTEDNIELQFGVNHIGHFLFTNLIVRRFNRKGTNIPRIVNVSSDGNRLGPVRFTDYNFDNGNTYDMWRGYGQSKTANALFSLELAKRSRKAVGKEETGGAGKYFAGIFSVSLHPGAIMTNLSANLSDDAFAKLGDLDRALGFRQFSNGFTLKSLQEGAATYVYAAFSPDLEKRQANGEDDHDNDNPSNANGRYLQDCAVLPYTDMCSWSRDPIDASKLWSLSEELVGQKFAA